MKNILLQRFRSAALMIMVMCLGFASAAAESVPVRYVQGTIHGFLELRSEDGHVLASGDLVQVAHGDRVTARMLFVFKDGSLYQEPSSGD